MNWKNAEQRQLRSANLADELFRIRGVAAPFDKRRDGFVLARTENHALVELFDRDAFTNWLGGPGNRRQLPVDLDHDGQVIGHADCWVDDRGLRFEFHHEDLAELLRGFPRCGCSLAFEVRGCTFVAGTDADVVFLTEVEPAGLSICVSGSPGHRGAFCMVA